MTTSGSMRHSALQGALFGVVKRVRSAALPGTTGEGRAQEKVSLRRLKVTACLAVLPMLVTACGDSVAKGGGSGDGNGNVTMWMYPTIVDPAANAAYWKKVTADFEKVNPGIHVKVDTQPWQGREQKQATALASGTGVDLLLLIPDQIPQFVKQGAIAPVDEAVAKSKDAFLPTAIDAVTYQDHVYGAPLYQTTNVPIYNKALFAKAGVAQLPRTWDEIEAAAPKLAALGVPILDYPGSSATTLNVSFYPLLWQAGGHVFTKGGAKAAFNGPEGLKALQFLLDLKSKAGLPKNAVSENNVIEGSQIAAGKAGMMLVAGPEAVGQLGAAIGADKVAVGPPLRADQQITYGIPGSIGLAKKSQNPKGALKFLEYLSSTQVIGSFAEASGYFSTRSDVTPKTDAPRAFTEALAVTFPGELYPSARQAMALISPHLQAALSGKVPPQQALDQAADEVNSLLAGS